MNRAELQQLAEDRLIDAQVMLAAGRWSGAYYLAGYAVELGLKSCVMKLIIDEGVIFEDKKFSEKCWTHDLLELVKLARLEKKRGNVIAANPAFDKSWQVVERWTEASRYQQMSRTEAEELYSAITDAVDGVMPWIRSHW